MSTWLRLLFVPLLAAGVIAVTAAPAAASCATPPRKSPHAFAGTVTSTERDWRIAHVTTDDGQKVVVNGAQSETGVTSVDRTYKAAARYEFHPLNDRSPYRDTACTATRRLSGGEAAGGSERSDAGFSWPSGATPAAIGAIAVVVITAAFLTVRRYRRPRPQPTTE